MNIALLVSLILIIAVPVAYPIQGNENDEAILQSNAIKIHEVGQSISSSSDSSSGGAIVDDMALRAH